MVTRCAESLKDTYEQIRLKMITLGLIHCDETGSRVDGKTCWVHVASDQNYTYLAINQKRGQAGMDAANVLPHAICCAHLLRELNGVIENHPEQTWAVRFKKFDMEYDSIIKTAYGENPFPETPVKKRGHKKKSKVLNLICRLYNYK